MNITEKKIDDFRQFLIEGVINNNYEVTSKEEDLFSILLRYNEACGNDGGRFNGIYLDPILATEETLKEVRDVDEAIKNLMSTYIIVNGDKIRLLEEAYIGRGIEYTEYFFKKTNKIFYLISEYIMNEFQRELKMWDLCSICLRPTKINELSECENCGKWYCEDCEEDCYRCIDCWDSILILPEEEEGEE